jgi:glycosyltransferase involved in cell wall biosynthesis
MRISLVIYGRLDTLTGGYLYDRFLVEALRERGHQVNVISLALKPYPLSLLDNLFYRPTELRSNRMCDLMLQDTLCHPSLICLNRKTRAGRRPTIIGIVHQLLCRQPRARILNCVYGWMERTYFRTLDGYLFTSRFNRDAARPLIGREALARVVTPAGDRLGRIASTHAILERSQRAGPLKLLFVGNLSPVKGLDQLLESLSRLPFAMWRLTIVGSLSTDSGYARRIRNLISSLGLSSQAHLEGAVDGERLRALYMDAHVFVMPFAHESFGIAALEAMAFGLPVIGLVESGLREFVRHAQNGFLVAAHDHEAVRRHLEQLYHNRDRLAAMGQAALQTFSARPTWDQTMRCGCEILEHMAASRQRLNDPSLI